MAKGKYKKWLEKCNLEQLTNWAANGCTDKEIAHNMGIHPSTYYDWIPKHPEISDAVEKGREMCYVAVENAFFKRAVGGIVVTEEIDEFKGTFKNGKPENGTGTRRTVKKHLPGDVAAQIFYLKNKGGYRSEPDVSVNVDVAPTFVYKRNG